MTVGSGYPLFMTWLAAHGYRERTIRAYRDGIRAFGRFWGVRSLRAVDREAIERWLAMLEQDGLKVRTRCAYLTAMRQFGKWCVRKGYWASNVAKEVDAPRVRRSVPNVPPLEDVHRLLAYLEELCSTLPEGHAKALALRNRAMVELAYGAALRPSELVKVHLSDIRMNDEEKRVLVRDGKGGRTRVVPFGEPARQALEAYLREGRPQLVRNGTHALFVANLGGPATYFTWRDAMRMLCQKAGLNEPIRPHQWRHRAATDTYRGGGDIFAVAKFLGHVGLANVEVYAALEPQHLQEWYAKAHPRA